jgi:Tol biopolymer transport system component
MNKAVRPLSASPAGDVTMRCRRRAMGVALTAFATCAVLLVTPNVEAPTWASEHVEAAKHVVAMIDGQLGPDPTRGAGIVFGHKDGHLYIATAGHVVRFGPHTATGLTVQLKMFPGRKLGAELMPQTAKGLDLAVLRVSGVESRIVESMPFRRLGDPAVLKRGAAVYHVGFSSGRPWRSNVTPDRFSELLNDAVFFESLSVRPGDSGGGLFNLRWELVGMVIADEAPEGQALSIERLLDQLRTWRLPVSLRYTVFHATKIAFMSRRDGRGDTYVTNVDGTQQTRITRIQTQAYSNAAYQGWLSYHRPSWSADGKTLAFVSDHPTRDVNRPNELTQAGLGDIFRVGVDGTGLLNLTNHPARDGWPSWSPDGQRIAFMSERSGRRELYVMNADGTKPRAVTRNTPSNADYEFPITWAPDSRRIAFVLDHDAKSSYRRGRAIHVADVDGGNTWRLTHDATGETEPIWSPDGKRIAFVGYDASSHAQGVFVVNIDGTRRVRLTQPHPVNEQIGYLSWSPDGTRILFSGVGGQFKAIWVVAAEGTGITRLTSGEWRDDTPVWSPDGTMIAFWSERYGEDFMGSRSGDICVMKADGSDQRCLTQHVGSRLDNDFLPSWSPFFR